MANHLGNKQKNNNKIDDHKETQKPNWSYNRLPAELWLRVMSHLKHIVDIGHLAMVSKSLNSIVDDHFLIVKELLLNYHIWWELDIDVLEPLLRRLPNLRETNLSTVIRRIKPNTYRALSDNCPFLTNLDLTEIKIAPGQLTSIMTYCDKITTLVVDGVEFEGGKWELTTMLNVARDRLKHLSARDIDNQALAKVTINQQFKLEYLDIRSTFGNATCVQLAVKCPKLKRLLCTLIVPMSDTGDTLNKILYGCPELEEIALRDYYSISGFGPLPIGLPKPKIKMDVPWRDQFYKYNEQVEYHFDNLSDECCEERRDLLVQMKHAGQWLNEFDYNLIKDRI